MERNDGEIDRGVSNAADANEFSGSPAEPAAENADRSGSSFDFAGTPGEEGKAMRDRAKNAVGAAGDRLSDIGSTVRERAGSAKNRLADVLETGAERLRVRGQSGSAQLAGAAASPEGGASQAIAGDGKVAEVSDRLAGGLDATASWLRDADLDGIKTGIERQVRDHPGRTLLIAAGLGYLIGRAFRNNQ